MLYILRGSLLICTDWDSLHSDFHRRYVYRGMEAPPLISFPRAPRYEPGELQPVKILECIVIHGVLYFTTLCRDNIVEIIHYRYLKQLNPALYRDYFRAKHRSY